MWIYLFLMTLTWNYIVWFSRIMGSHTSLVCSWRVGYNQFMFIVSKNKGRSLTAVNSILFTIDFFTKLYVMKEWSLAEYSCLRTICYVYYSLVWETCNLKEANDSLGSYFYILPFTTTLHSYIYFFFFIIFFSGIHILFSILYIVSGI